MIFNSHMIHIQSVIITCSLSWHWVMSLPIKSLILESNKRVDTTRYRIKCKQSFCETQEIAYSSKSKINTEFLRKLIFPHDNILFTI